jgi:hypothetical protein
MQGRKYRVKERLAQSRQAAKKGQVIGFKTRAEGFLSVFAALLKQYSSI